MRTERDNNSGVLMFRGVPSHRFAADWPWLKAGLRYRVVTVAVYTKVLSTVYSYAPVAVQAMIDVEVPRKSQYTSVNSTWAVYNRSENPASVTGASGPDDATARRERA